MTRPKHVEIEIKPHPPVEQTRASRDISGKNSVPDITDGGICSLSSVMILKQLDY